MYWFFSLASIPVLASAPGYADSFLIPAEQPLLAGDLILQAPSGTLPCTITQTTTSKKLHVLMVLGGLPLQQWEETKQWLYRLQTVSGFFMLFREILKNNFADGLNRRTPVRGKLVEVFFRSSG
jgi:hypothetical protein